MQTTHLLHLAACALSMGAVAAQSAPRVLHVDETPAASTQSSEVQVLRSTPTSTPMLLATPGAVVPALQQAAQQGFLGVQLTNGEAKGASVAGLVDGAPAQLGGLQAGDRIVSVNGQAVETSEALTSAVRGMKPGAVVKLTIARGDETLTKEITLGTRGGAVVAAPLQGRTALRGLRVDDDNRAQGHDDGDDDDDVRGRDHDDDDEHGDDDDDDDDDEHEHEGHERRAEGQPRQRVRMRMLRPDGQADGGQVVVVEPGERRVRLAQPRGVEVRKEVRQDGDGKAQVKVWVNGEEVDPGQLGADAFGWVEEDNGHGFTFKLDGSELELGELEDVTREGGSEFEQFVIELNDEGHEVGQMRLKGQNFFTVEEGGPKGTPAQPRAMLFGAKDGAQRLSVEGQNAHMERRIMELENRIERMQREMEELRAMLGDQRRGNAQGRGNGQGRGNEQGQGANRGPGDERNNGRAQEPQQRGQQEGQQEGPRRGGEMGERMQRMRGTPGQPGRGDNDPNADLRNEIRELTRAIERMQQRGDGR
ncbi:MAG: PDZ domain-containing protein [Planctomycetota bacterium]